MKKSKCGIAITDLSNGIIILEHEYMVIVTNILGNLKTVLMSKIPVLD
jgi:hypothetical protein